MEATAADQSQAQGPTFVPVVLDTNIVLDLLVFGDPHCAELRAAIEGCTLQWLATAAMREELLRVLDYPQLQPRLAFHGLLPAQVMAAFDARAIVCPVAPKAPYTCKDPDDQKFIDLAAAHRTILLSKDHAVTSMRKRLLAVGVVVARSYGGFGSPGID